MALLPVGEDNALPLLPHPARRINPIDWNGTKWNFRTWTRQSRPGTEAIHHWRSSTMIAQVLETVANLASPLNPDAIFVICPCWCW
jgi:hypothetical protein